MSHRTDTALVSILIPAHDAAPWIRETIESALLQTWPHTEVVVVDDGSTDDTAAIAASFAPRGVRLIRQQRRGAAAARNRAMEDANGDFLQFLDADDLLSPNKIARQVTRLEHEASCVASCAWARFYSTPSEAVFEEALEWMDADPVAWLACAWSSGGMMHPAAWLVPSDVARRAGPWDERLSLNDDGEYFARIVISSAGVRFCGDARTFYRSGNGNSLSGAKSRTAWQSGLLSLELGTKHLLAAEESSRTKKASAAVFQRYAYEVFAQQPDLAGEAQRRADELGGSNVAPNGGPLFLAVARILGWRRASVIRQRVYALGYERAAIGWRLARAVKAWRHRSRDVAMSERRS